MDVSTLGIAVDSQPVKAADTALAGLTQRSKEAEAAAQKLVDKWKDKANALNKTQREIDAYKLALGGATEAQKREAQAAMDAVDAHEKLEKKLASARNMGALIGKGIAAGFTAALTAATGFIVGLDHVLKKVGELQDISEKTMAPVETLIEMKTAADIAGVSLETVGNAMNQMQRRLAAGSDEAKGAARGLKAIGIEIDEFRQKDPGEQFRMLAEAMADVENNGGKVAVIQDIIGRSGAEMLPFLKEYADKQNRLTIMTKEAVEQADAYADTQAKARSELSQYIGLIASSAAPTMTAFTKAVTETIKQFFDLDNKTSDLRNNTGVKDFAQGAAMFLAHVVDAAVGVTDIFRKLGLGAWRLAEAVGAVLNANLLDQESLKAAGQKVRDIWAQWNKEAASQPPSFADNLKKQFAEIDKASEATGKKAARNLSGYTSRDDKDAKQKADQTIAETNRIIDGLQKRQLAEEALLNGGRKLTEWEKLQIDTITQVYSANSKLNDSQKARIMHQLAATTATMQDAQALKDRQAHIAEVTKAQEKWNDELEKQAEQMQKQRDALRDVQQAEKESVQDQTRILDAEAAAIGQTDRERRISIATIQEEIKFRKELEKINDTPFDNEADREAARQRAAETHERRLGNATREIYLDEQRETYSRANDLAHTFFTDLFNDGTSAFRNLGRSLKTLLIDALYELTLKKWVINIVANMTGAGGIAGAAGGAVGNSIIQGLTGAVNPGGVLGMLGGAASSFGMGLSAGFSALTGEAGIMGAMSAGATSIGAGQIAAGLGTIAGALGPIALGVYGLYKAFGSKKGGPKVEGSAGFGAGGADDYGRFGNELDSKTADIVKTLNSTYGRMADMLGVVNRNLQFGVGLSMDPRGTAPSFLSIQGSNGAVYRNRNVGRSDEELQAAITEGISWMIVESLKSSGMDAEVSAYFEQISQGLTGEAKLQALEAAAAMVSVRDQLRQLGGSVTGLGNISLQAAANIIQFAGGIDRLSAGIMAYQQNFFSAAEQQRIGYDNLAKMMNSPGSGFQGATGANLASWDKQFFRKVVEGLDMTTEAGQRQFATMMNLAGQFASLKSAEEAAAAQAQAKAEQERALAEQRAREAEEQRKAYEELQRTISGYSYSLWNFGQNMHEMVRAMVVAGQGGARELNAALQSLLGNYSTFAERRMAVGKELAAAFGATGESWYSHLANPNEVMKMAREDFIQIFRTINLNTASGRQLANEMLRLQGAFSSVTKEIREPVYYTVDSALAKINEKYEEQVGKARELRNSLAAANKAFTDFTNSMMIDEGLSNLKPGERFAETRQQYERARIEMERDQYSSESVSRFTQIARTFLESGRDMFGSGQDYQTLFDKIKADMDAAAAVTKSGMSAQDKQIAALDAQVAQFKTANRTLDSIDQGIKILYDVWRGNLVVESVPWGARGAGIASHAGGMSRIPYDGYRMVAHRDEAVLNAQEANAWRSGGNLLSELKSLRAEVIALRRENRQDAGNTIGATFEAAQRAANIQSEATVRAAKQRTYQGKTRPVAA